ncbi:TDP-N-acetylfucosamine:lipid II N-acetylfucosaminyltransferase [Vibrio cyclitrophicus]
MNVKGLKGVIDAKVSDYDIIHIVNNDKFIDSYYRLVCNKCSGKRHLFIYLFGEPESKFPIPENENVVNVNNLFKKFKNSYRLMCILNGILSSGKKVIFHGLFSVDLQRALFFLNNKLSNSYWFMWGADLYAPVIQERSIRNVINNFIAKRPKGAFYGLVTYIYGDFELAQKMYKSKSIYKECILYPSNVCHVDFGSRKNKISKEVKVLLGNSADPTNNHIELLNDLSMLDTGGLDIKIYCPLSYGNQDYAKRVIEYGTELFGNRFIPLVEFISLNRYQDMLSEIDFAIFGHRRQQAMGNIINLIGMGKTVYLNKNITTYEFMKSKGISVRCINNIDLVEIKEEEKENNKSIISGYFNEEKLISQLNDIFEE